MNPTTDTDPGLQALGDALNASFRAFRWLLILLLAGYLASGIFVVAQHEKALVLRFGRIAGVGNERIKQPGLHWTLPRPFCEIVRVPAERVQSLATDTFWHRRSAEFQDDDANAPGLTLQPERDGYLLTGDANILHARWSVRFTVLDPETYILACRDRETALRDELDRAVTHVTARFPIDRALRTDIESFRSSVERELVARSRDLGLGIRVQGVDLLALIPPRQVARAFDEVVQSEQERDQKISEARAFAVRTRNETAGESARRLAEAQALQRAQVADISADADAFQRVLPQYVEQPDVFLQTLQQDRVRRALARTEQKFVIHRKEGRQEIRLQLGREGRRPDREAAE